MMRYYKSDLFVTICVVYLDDILIFSVSLEEHLQALDKVLFRLKQRGFIIQPNKCIFLKRDCAEKIEVHKYTFDMLQNKLRN